jgi:hypothetical protein
MRYMVSFSFWFRKTGFRAKKILLSVLIVCSLVAFGADGLLRAADMCTTTSGLLDMTHLIQQEEVWCFVTSSNEVLNYLQVMDPQSMSVPPFYSPCRLYNIAKNPGTDCCLVSHPTGVPQCLQTGWPDEVFENLIPPIPSTPEGAQWWPHIKDQICPAGAPGRPFIYLAHPPGGIPHTYTAVGFNENYNGTGQKVLYVHSHETVGSGPMGSGIVDYECYYIGDCPNNIYTHDGDYYDINLPALSSVDTMPPKSPTGLTLP